MRRVLDRSSRPIGIVVALVAAVTRAASAQPPTHVFGNPAVWQWAPTRTYHVENYKLSLHFDEAKGEVFGDQLITLRPFTTPFRKFYVNSAELTIDAVTLERADGSHVTLQYSTQDPRLWITLDRDYDPTRALKVRIVYHGFPRTGLFFVNPSPSYPQWPHEVFSQGETEFNRFWLPCWDYPNDMATSETITTVPEGQSVLSNGKLVKVTRARGQVTYDWVESVPHSSYLISIAVGPWHKFADSYHAKPVDYYVPSTVDEATARRSLHLTPDMIGFFSRASGVEYPYEQYAQVTAQNYMFGGQENVSATTLSDRTLHDARADQDYPSTNLVSHELGQHWFGDYVQGRDWSNIWLNEGFATYLEALYTQYHEGYDAYRLDIYNDQLTEQREDRDAYRRPLVDRHYTDPLYIIDATTHQKGADVLDMLRYLIDGPEAARQPASQHERLFQALHYYLVTHHAETAETANLIDAIRATTGEEIDWFFREWVFLPGHPDYRVEATYDAAKKSERVTVTQTQDTTGGTPIYDMPIQLAFYGANGERKQTQVRDNLQRQSFDVPLEFEPRWVDFDPDDFIDKTVQFAKTVDALIAEAEDDPSMMSRLWAVQQLRTPTLGDTNARLDALTRVLGGDRFYAVRAAAATSIGSVGTDRAKSALVAARAQPDSRVRTAVFEALGNFSKDPTIYGMLVDALHGDSSYAVEAAAARQLGRSGAPQAFDVLQAEIVKEPEVHVMQATLSALAATKDPRAVPILIARAQPGGPELIRLSALAGLGIMKGEVTPDQTPDVVQVVGAALRDPYYPTQRAGQQLVGVFGLTQFEPEVQAMARNAPMAMQRDPAQRILDQLQGRSSTQPVSNGPE